MEYMNDFVSDKYRVTEFAYKSNLSLSEAKENIRNGLKDV